MVRGEKDYCFFSIVRIPVLWAMEVSHLVTISYFGKSQSSWHSLKWLLQLISPWTFFHTWLSLPLSFQNQKYISCLKLSTNLAFLSSRKKRGSTALVSQYSSIFCPICCFERLHGTVSYQLPFQPFPHGPLCQHQHLIISGLLAFAGICQNLG